MAGDYAGHEGIHRERAPVRERVRWVAIAVLAFLALLGMSGILSSTVFTQASAVKWVACALPPAAAIGLLLTTRPMTAVAAVVVLLAPFADTRIKVVGLGVSPHTLLCGVGMLLAMVVADPPGSRQAGRRTALRTVLPAVPVLLLPAVLLGPGYALPHFAAMLALVLATGTVCLRACAVDPRAGVILATAMVATAVVQAGTALYELHTGHAVNIYGGAGVEGYGPGYFFTYDGTFRPSGTFSDPISLGNVLAVGLPMAFALATSRRLPTPLRVVNGAGAIVISLGLAVSLSRMSWIGAAAGAAVAVAVSAPGDRLRRLGWAAGAGAGLQAMILAMGGRPVVERLQSILDPTARTVSTAGGDMLRQRLWSASLRAFTEHPFFGIGMGRLSARLTSKVPGAGVFTHAHSTYLQYLAEAGLAGAAAVVAVLLAAAVDIWRGLRGSGRLSPVMCGAAGGLAAVTVSWLTDYVVRYPAVLACLAVLFALAAAEGTGRNPIREGGYP
ncbi:MAG: hypothetical protein V7603_5785 [Micromonosporaceae bacterium]